MSASTGAPSALARSEGSIEAAKGTAVATAAAPPAQALAMTSVRRPRLIPALFFIERSLLEKALSRSSELYRKRADTPNFWRQAIDSSGEFRSSSRTRKRRARICAIIGVEGVQVSATHSAERPP